MEHRQAADCGSIIRTQKHDNRINRGHDLSVGRLSDMAHDLSVGRLSDMAGDANKRQTDDLTVSTPSGTKSPEDSSPAWQELARTTNVEKFVYETDKCQSIVVVHVDSVSNSYSCCLQLQDGPNN